MSKKYKTNFLEKVIFRIDFDFANLGDLSNAYNKIKSLFPIQEEEKGEEGFVDFDIKKKQIMSSKVDPISSWVFFDKNRNKKIKIHPRFAFVEYFKYENSTTLIKDVKILSDMLSVLKIEIVKKIGLRYQNNIKLNDNKYLDWNDIIDARLIKNLDFVKDNNKSVSRLMSQIIFKCDFGDINFNYGIWNSGFPSEVTEKSFILDLDARSKFPTNIKNNPLTDIATEYNLKIKELFELVIDDKLRKIMEK